MLRGIWGFIVSLGWVGGSLLFSALSVAIIILLGLGMSYAFRFAGDISFGFGLLVAFVLYLLFLWWVAWKFVLSRVSPKEGSKRDR